MQSQLYLFREPTKSLARFPSTRYQGSKLKFSHWIWECIKDIQFHSVLDAFGGTGAVSFRFKQEGKSVTYNDILPFNAIIGKALIENQRFQLDESDICYILSKHPHITYDNFISNTFHDIYYTDNENIWLDNIIANIREIKNPYKQAIAYFALFQSCIIKRPYNLFHRRNLYIRLQDVRRTFGNKKTWDTSFETHFKKFVNEANNAIFNSATDCYSTNKDALNITDSYDLVYIDTPYLNEAGTGVNYADFYHFLNGIVDYKNWKNKIDYNSKNLRLVSKPSSWNNSSTILSSFESLFNKFKDSILVVSYRSNGIPSIESLITLLEQLNKTVRVFYSAEMKYALSQKSSSEVLIVAT